MKILIFCPYYPPHIGGLESHSDEFNKHLSQKGTEITVFTPQLPETAPEKEAFHNNVGVIRFPAFELIPNWPLPEFWKKNYRRQNETISKEKFDIVISRTRFFSTSILALLHAKKNKIPWIHIEHGSDHVKLNNLLFSALAKLYDITIGKFILKKADAVIANSNASADFCRKLSPGRKIEVIYRGVETEIIEAINPDFKIKEKYGDKTIINFTGRLIDGKGVADLISAFSEIKEEESILFIVGDGPQKDYLKKLASDLQIKEKIVFFWTEKT